MAYINIGQILYPPGSVFMSEDNTSPSDLIGGTWIKWNAGYGPVQSGSYEDDIVFELGQNGGSAKVTLTKETMPSHEHRIRRETLNGGLSNNRLGSYRTNCQAGSLWYMPADDGSGVSQYIAEAIGGGGQHTKICRPGKQSTFGHDSLNIKGADDLCPTLILEKLFILSDVYTNLLKKYLPQNFLEELGKKLKMLSSGFQEQNMGQKVESLNTLLQLMKCRNIATDCKYPFMIPMHRILGLAKQQLLHTLYIQNFGAMEHGTKETLSITNIGQELDIVEELLLTTTCRLIALAIIGNEFLSDNSVGDK